MEATKRASEVSTALDDERVAAAEQGNLAVEEHSNLPSKQPRISKGAVVTLLLLGVVVAVVVVVVCTVNPSSSKPKSSASQQSPSQSQNMQGPTVFNASGVFNTSVELFNAGITKGYSSSDDMKSDLSNAMKFFLNGVVANNLNGAAGTGNSGGGTTDATSPANRPAASMDSQAGSSSSASKISDYGTHNQEAGVEEGDVIVSNGEAVFAAYGGYILVWNATSGAMISTIDIPGFNQTYSWDNSTYWSQPQVQQLLLFETRLLVIINGYGSTFSPPDGRSYPILSSYKSTQVRLYSIESLANLELLYKEDINGYFSSTRAINGNVHIVTTSGIDTYTDLVEPFQIQNYNKTSNQQYLAAVQQQAEAEAIPRFVNELMAELTIDSVFPNMFRISLFQSQLADANLEESMFTDGLVNSVTLVHSLDMTAADSTTLKLSISGAFLPSWSADVYSSTDMLIVSGQQWEYNQTTNSSYTSTYLLSFQLNDATSTPYSTGKIPGYVLNAQSVDVAGTVLRVATTLQTTWGGWWGPIMFDGVGGIKRKLVDQKIAVGRLPFFHALNRTTENYVILIDLSQPNSTMTELGRLQLGKPEETFTAVRFFDNIAYAVTFEQTDPLYVLDLSDPTKPAIKAELELSGFSENLDSINSDNTLMLAIGQETDVNGTTLGMQISVFDFTDLTNVKVAQRYLIEKNTSAWSSSDAEWNYQAIRYTDGRLIIPLDIYNWQSPNEEFHGFAIFTVNANEISAGCRIATSDPAPVYYPTGLGSNGTNTTQVCDNYCAWLPRRSFVFNGQVMTTDAHQVESTDMDTCKQDWHTDIVIKDPNSGCCW